MHECERKVTVIEPAADPDGAKSKNIQVQEPQREKKTLATLRCTCRRTQRPAFQLDMFGRIVLDPKILRKLGRVRRG